jgi:hypothetical protein
MRWRASYFATEFNDAYLASEAGKHDGARADGTRRRRARGSTAAAAARLRGRNFMTGSVVTVDGGISWLWVELA